MQAFFGKVLGMWEETLLSTACVRLELHNGGKDLLDDPSGMTAA